MCIDAHVIGRQQSDGDDGLSGSDRVSDEAAVGHAHLQNLGLLGQRRALEAVREHVILMEAAQLRELEMKVLELSMHVSE